MGVFMQIIKRILSVLLFFASFISLTGGVSLAQDCDRVLDSVYNKIHVKNDHSFSQAAREYVCSHKSEILSQSSKGGGGFNIFGILSAEGGGEGKSSKELIDDYCSSSSLDISDSSAYELFSEIVDPSVLEAWKECISISSSQFPVQIRKDYVDGNFISVTAKFVPNDDNLGSNPLIDRYTVINARNIGGKWVAGNKITIAGLSHDFERINENEPVIITLYTSMGRSKILKINPVSYPKEIGTIRAYWTEQYEAEGEPKAHSIISDYTPNWHNREGAATNSIRFVHPSAIEGQGELRDVVASCIEGFDGACNGWQRIVSINYSDYRTADVIWQTWSRPTKWKISGNWYPKVTKIRQGSSEVTKLVRGSEVSIKTPGNFSDMKFVVVEEGVRREVRSDDDIKALKWLKFISSNHSPEGSEYRFRVNSYPNKSN